MENILAFITPSDEALLGFGIVFLIGLPFIILALIYFVLAENNIFFTKAKENIASFVMRGDTFTGKVIAPSQTLYINEDYEILRLEDLPSELERSLARIKYSTTSFLGMSWIGLWPFYSLYYRRQQWQEWKTLVENGDHVIVSRDEQTPYLFINAFEYAIRTTEAEDKYGVPLTVVFTIIVAPTNATRPIFGVHDAYGQLQRLCIAEAIKVIKGEEFATFGATLATGTNVSGTNLPTRPTPANPSLPKTFSDQICELNDAIPDRPDGKGVIEFLGYEILDAQLNTVEIAGENKAALLKASTAKFVAIEEAKAVVEKAEGDKKRDKLVAEGQEYLNQPKVKYFNDISRIPGSMEVEKRRATPNVTTLVEGKDVNTVLPLKP